MFQIIDNPDPVMRQTRGIQILPRLIEASGFFTREQRDGKLILDKFTLVKDMNKQVVKVDERSCGVFAMMHADRLIQKADAPVGYGESLTTNYRKYIATRLL